VATTIHLPGARVRLGAGARGRTTAWTLLAARLRGTRLDRELAAGVQPWHSPAHSARSLQITSRVSRRALARGLDRMQARAAGPTATWTAAVPVDGRAVREEQFVLDLLADRLRDGAPISTRSVAALRYLMSDGSSPFYRARKGNSLAGVLAEVHASLDVPD
jgi:hypothetical protein